MQRHASAGAMECNLPVQTSALPATCRAAEASAPPVHPVADTAIQPMPPVPCGRLLEQLDMEAAIGCGWWETDLASMVLAAVTAGPLMGVFTAIAQVLREGGDPDIVVGATNAEAAFGVAQEWVDAGIDPVGVVGWLRAGCWKPTAARAMTDAGLRPWRLLNQTGSPLHWVEITTAAIEQIPLARAVAEEFLSIDQAVKVVIRHAHAPVTTTRIVEGFRL
jgi:hypothetical protein